MPTGTGQGNAQKIISNADFYSGTLATLRASLVVGTTINVNRSWITLAEFLAGNPGGLASDSAGNKDFLISGNRLGSNWIPARGQWEVSVSGKIDFSTVNAGTNIAGVVFYSDADSNSPTTARFLGASERPFVGGGGTATWGGDGENPICAIIPQQISNTIAFQGWIDRFVRENDPWVTNTWKLGAAMVQQGNGFTPLGSELTMAQINPLWCTNMDPTSSEQTGVIVPLTTGFERVTGWASDPLNEWQWNREKEGAGGVEMRWPQTGGTGGDLTIGQQCIAAVFYMFQGAYAAASAYPMLWDANISKTIEAGQAIVLGNTANQRVKTAFLRAA